MRAGLKRNVGRGSADITSGIVYGHDLCMGLSGPMMPACAYDPIVAYKNTTYRRIGIGCVKSEGCEP